MTRPPAGKPPARWRRNEPIALPPTLTGALEAFRERGYHGASIRDIARRVGVTTSVLYYHHGSKQGLLIALLVAGLRDLLARLQRAAADAGPQPLPRFRNVVEAIVLHQTYRQDLAVLDAELRYLEPEHRVHYAALRCEVEQMLSRAIADGTAQGAFRVASIEETTRALLGMLAAIACWYRPDGPLHPAELAERYVENALNAVRATRPSFPASQPE